MRAALFHEHGPPSVLRLEELPDPVPGPGMLRLRVQAVALNHLDLWVRRGLPTPISLPHVGGSDIAGTVEEVGPGVEGIPPGSRVVVDPSIGYGWYASGGSGAGVPGERFRILGEHLHGGCAEQVVVPAANAVPLPPEVDFETAAASSLAGVTAWRAVVGRGGARPGERVVITGGSGGVATFAIQFARIAGAEVHVVTSGAANRAGVLELGAHHAWDRLEGDPKAAIWKATGKRGVDLVVDSVGGADWGGWIRTLAPGGRLVSYGATAGPVAPIDLRLLFWKQASLLGTTMGTPAEYREAMELVFRGVVRPVIHTLLPLDRIREAHELLESGGVFGKVVLRP